MRLMNYEQSHYLKELEDSHKINMAGNGHGRLSLVQKTKVKVIPKTIFDDTVSIYDCRKYGYQLDTKSRIYTSTLGSLLLYDFDYFAPMLTLPYSVSLTPGDFASIYIKNDITKYPNVQRFMCWDYRSEPLIEFLYRYDKDVLFKLKSIQESAIPAYVWGDMALRFEQWRNLLFTSLKCYFTKTSVRKVFHSAPGLLPYLEVKHILESPLSIKEWVLMLNHLSKYGVKFNKETEDYLAQELSVGVLRGKSKTSVYTKKAVRSFSSEE